jgi:hypothetical protein
MSKPLSLIEGQGQSGVDKDEIWRDEPIDLTGSVVRGFVRISRAGTQEITVFIAAYSDMHENHSKG